MISLDIKSDAKTASSSPLNLSTPSDEPTLSFSQLLRGVSEIKDDKVIQNGSLILSLGADDKPIKDAKGTLKVDTLLGLLKADELPQKEEPVELNPKIVENLSVKDIKVLVADAKNYLKEKIQASDDYKLSKVKELPKTLKGLASMAKKLGIDVSKITIEEVQTKQPVNKLANIKDIPVKEIAQDKEITKKSEPIRDILQHKELAKKDVQTKAQTTIDVKEIPKEVKETPKEVKVQTTINVKEIAKEVDTKSTKTKALHVDIKPQTSQVEEVPKKEKKISDIKQTPLFKAQEVTQTATTEQIVQVKVSSTANTQVKTAKDRADETLKLLLRGDKPSMKDTGLTADFSVATAKVIAPSATTDSKKAIQSLLHGDAKHEVKDIDGTPESVSVHKADSFEVKLNEAKQMTKYLSQDVKSAIQDYKSPFTRVKVQLNPQRLGEVDLTIVQRGKNLHINITSNNTAINTLAMNANDLKVQLSNNGINNASLNFNNNAQDGQNAQQNQQNRQQERQANEEYNYFDKEETNEEVLSSLEIVVPQYG